jgi:hypothetical protein
LVKVKIVAMKKKFKNFYLLVSSVIISILHLPLAFAKSTGSSKLFFTPLKDSIAKNAVDSMQLIPSLRSAYDSLHLNLKGLSLQAYDYAKQGFDKLLTEGRVINDSIISIIDFTLPSYKKRLFVIDLKNYKILYNSLVAHGINTGREWATSFSNKPSSYMSSPGFYVTKETYQGKHGLSLRLEGLESGINDHAYERGIVVHGAQYVSENIARAQGFIGRSQGCPAVPDQLSTPIINTIKNGTCMFIFHPSYIERSEVLN